MRITELSLNTRMMKAIRFQQEASGKQRSGGLHLSDILQDMLTTLYPKQFGVRDAEPDDRTRMYFEIGNALEDMISTSLRDRIPGWHKPIPKQVEGVWCSPDGHSARTKTIDEIKATWKSARDFLDTPKWWAYTVQTMAYMHGWEATRGRIHIFFLNGDYRPPAPMAPRTFIITPSERELKQNWKMLLDHAKDRGML